MQTTPDQILVSRGYHAQAVAGKHAVAVSLVAEIRGKLYRIRKVFDPQHIDYCPEAAADNMLGELALLQEDLLGRDS